MKKKSGASFIQSAAILMAASIVVKLIGALFSIPLTNIYGADGTGIFNVAYYIYTALFIIATAGLPVAVSKMVSEATTLGRHREARKIGRLALISFSLIGAFFTALMMLGVDAFLSFASNSMARYAVLAIAPSIFFVAIMSAIRGYYQGLSDMMPTAISQVIEALGKLIFGLLLAYYLMDRGYNLEIVVAGAIGGVTIGTVLSAAYIILIRLRDVRREKREDTGGQACAPSGALLKRLFKIAIPVTVGASVMSLTNLIDMFLVMSRLQDGGMTEPQANYVYGAYGMAVKFFNLPQTIIVGIGISIIPAISAALVLKNRDRAKSLTESSFRLTALLSLPCAVGLAVLPKPIMDLLYYSVPNDVIVAAPLLTLLGPAVLLVAMVSVTNAILQAIGKETAPVFTMLMGGIVKLIANYTMVGTPSIGIHGAPIGTSFCYGTVMVLNLIVISRTGVRFSFRASFLKPMIAAAVMGVFAYFAYAPMAAVLGAKLGVLIDVLLSGVIYLMMIFVTRALPKSDILMLPNGEKIAKLLKINE